MNRKVLPRRLTRSCERVAKAVATLSERMKSGGFSVSSFSLWPAVVIHEWATGEEWTRIVQKTGIADGDLAMLIMRTADNLRQIGSLKATHPETAALAWKAREAILREPVVFD